MRTTLRLARRHYVLGAIVALVTILAGHSLIARVGSSIASMHVARRQQTATMLANGSVLLAGGENRGAAIAEAELFDPSTGSITRLPRAIAARASHTATLVAGGRVLLAGGRDGIVTLDSSELFDPASGTFAVGPRLQRPRAGHAATVMADGRVLITGGDGERTAEIYDGAFHLLGREMDGDRRDHSALLLRDGTILVTGGRDAGGMALATAEIFDPVSESFARIGSMSSARVRPVMHPLPDGKVQIVGGDADATMEIYDPSTQTFTARAYLGVLQPQAIANSVAAFAFVGRHLNAEARRSAIAAGVIQEDQDVAELTPVEGRGEWLVTSGNSPSGRTLSAITVLADSAAWVTTDKADYAPGEVVTVTGGGFAPNETVTLLFERNPETSPSTTITTVADADGNIVNSDYVCLDTDANVTFTLTATGTSGAVAITSFTDGTKAAAVSVGAQSAALTAGTAGTTTYLVTVTRGGTGAASITLTTAGLPASVSASFSPETVSFTSSEGTGTSKTSTLTLTTTAATPAATTNFTIHAAQSTNDWAETTGTLLVSSGNAAPVLASIGAQSASEGTLLTFTATATDSDTPAQTLTFSLDAGAPAGASINSSTGVFTWTPGESDGGTTPSVTVRVTDNGSPAKNDFETITITVAETNEAPVLGAIGSQSASEGSLLTFTASSTDSDLPANTLTYSLDPGAPSGASINASTGVFNWTPGESDGGTTPTVTVRVTDNGSPAKNDFETITITVAEVNEAPVLATIGSQSASEGSLLTFTASATDSDLPANTLTYSLDPGAPSGASINASTGVFNWTPGESDGGTTPSVTVRVTDNGSPGKDDFETITITVAETNDAPVLGAIGSQSASEGSLLTFTASATDSDLPANTLTYSLDPGAPSGASINASTGVFNWTPGESDGGTTPSVTVRVTDNGSPAKDDFETITITVAETNDAPVLAAIGSQSASEGSLLTFTASATDSDLPANTLTYSLDPGAPSGASINASTGVFTWTPGESDGGTTPSITIRVTDNGSPAKDDSETITITVAETNEAPVLATIGSQSAGEGSLLTFTASASDSDLPANTLTYSLDAGAPAGASINATTGVFTWTPGESDGGTAPNVTIRVTDNGSPAKNDFETITITVAETNEAPVLGAIGNKSTPWGTPLSFSASATDVDIPANTLAFSLDATSIAAGMSMTSAGAFSWTPSSSDVGAHTVTVTVTDNGSPNLSDSETFTITVGRRATMVTYGGETTKQYSDQANVSATLVDAATLAPISGATISFTLVTDTASATTNGSGVAATTLIVTQAPGTPNMVTSFAGDTLYLSSSDSDVFTVTEEDARVYNTTPLYVSTGCSTCGTATVTFSATITDITAETTDLAYDAFAGDIRNAIVDFVNRDAGNAVLCTANVGLVSASDTKVGTAACDKSIADGTPVHVGVVVRGYYTRNSSGDNFELTVAKPELNSITGGGYLVLSPNASGMSNPTSGTKNNFGFNVKYNKSGKNLQGNINTIIRSGSSVLQIKGNALTSLTVNTTNGTSTFVSKASLQDVTDPMNPIPIAGNYTLQLQMTDRGEPGSLDSIAITVFDKSGGVWYTSNWNGRKTDEQTIAGGNLSVH